jgi:hypothetical protein
LPPAFLDSQGVKRNDKAEYGTSDEPASRPASLYRTRLHSQRAYLVRRVIESL